jgi:hypothetical protein
VSAVESCAREAEDALAAVRDGVLPRPAPTTRGQTRDNARRGSAGDKINLGNIKSDHIISWSVIPYFGLVIDWLVR